MKDPFDYIQEQAVTAAFNKQSPFFDAIYSSNSIIKYKRERVRSHVQKFLKPNSAILEINAGTGEDAVFFAQQGHRVHATDIAAGMREVLVEKAKKNGLAAQITNELCSFTTLENLQKKEEYDLIFSNFAGLNCTHELKKVLDSFSPLLKSGGIVTMVLLPKFCLWETLMVCKGKFKTAFRRFFSKRGRISHIEGEYFRCWYYNPSYIIRHLKDSFNLIGLEGLCTIVPPSYIEHFAEKHPRTFGFLKGKEDQLKDKWPWKFVGDYYIISLKKKTRFS
jgi:ubiquinone/menaquinone biosynthesis C-methylase UbiE